MAFRVQEFRSQLEYDGARPNLFEARLSFPTSAVEEGDPNRKFTFMCRAAQLPGTTVNPVPLMYFGRELKFAGNRQFQDWQVTIINDEDFVIRKAFERWMNGLNSHVSNLRSTQFESALDYQQDATIIQYGKAGDILKVYNFTGLFPTDVSPIELDWGSNDNIEEYSVTFAYQWWESETTT
jgi:hypothetical protein